MSKKKNPLKDLNDFLQQQATTLAAPVQIGTDPENKKTASEKNGQHTEVTPEKIIGDLESLASKNGIPFRTLLYDIIIRSTERQASSLPEDKMLVNTALYLKSGEQWKEAIREYWKKR